MSRPIVFLTDYGLQDEFVGICHGVIARAAPEVRVIDLDHGIPAHDIVRGALTFASAAPYMPADSVYLGVVDPGVGSPRESIAVRTESGAFMVGPDNGLLSMAWKILGGAAEAVRISSAEVVHQPVSKTFHGRDVFSPAAAFLATGGELDSLGPALDLRHLEHVELPEPDVTDGRIVCEVIGIDRFGNVSLNVNHRHMEVAGLAQAFNAAGRWIPQVGTFADAPGQELAAIWDSSGWLALVVTRGSAAAALHATLRSPITLERHS